MQIGLYLFFKTADEDPFIHTGFYILFGFRIFCLISFTLLWYFNLFRFMYMLFFIIIKHFVVVFLSYWLTDWHAAAGLKNSADMFSQT